jgi:hypothetical protein
MRKVKLKLSGVLLFCALLSSASFALLNVNFSESLQPGQISFYWATDTMTANLAGRTPNSNPAITLSLSAGNQAKALSTPLPTAQYAFFSDNTSVPSQTTYIRVWNTTGHNPGDHYTALENFANPWGSPANVNFAVDYVYVYSDPQQAVITQIDETGTTVLAPPSTGRSLTFTSVQPEVGGYMVEVAQSEWEITLNGTRLEPNRVVAGLQLVLSTPADSLNAGDNYVVRVRHQNPWGTWGPWSETATHTIAVAGAAVETITFNFRRAADGIGINPFSFPLSNVTDPAGLGNVRQLIEQFNTAAGANAVATFGWFDTTGMIPQGYIIVYDSDTVNDFDRFIPIGGVGAPETVDLVMDQPYQVYVLREFAATLTGNRVR